MASKSSKIKSLVATDRLTADGGTVLRDRHGAFRIRRIVKFGFAGFIFLCALFGAYASVGLPFPGKVSAARAQATEIYARDGQTLLYTIRGDKNRTPIAFDQMPSCIKDATVAIEDKTFYKHKGLDPRGFGRAVVANFEGGFGSQGGSTITQQLVKNALLSPEQTLTRKAKELILSLEIEQIYPKDRILELYLNEIPYGSNAYGIQAASQTYFAKNPKDLTLAQCATLASIPRGPTFYSPYNNADPTRLQNRSKLVLDEMVSMNKITTEQATAAKAEIDQGLEFAAAKGEDIKAPHFVFYVREQLEQKYGTKATQEGGFKVITTLDIGKQDIAESTIQDARARFPGYGASNAALTAIDPKTGELLAMVGSVDYFDTANDGNVNVATSDRQPGSSFKPLVYLKGFQEGYDPNLKMAFNPATLLWDVKTDFGGGYSPNNYDGKFRGPVSARDALQQSLNVPAVKMVDLVGINDSVDFAHQMGITTLDDPDRLGDSVVLGGGEVKLVDLTSAYNVMANQGQAAYSKCFDATCSKRTNVTPILKITDRKNKDVTGEFNGNVQRNKEIVSKENAYQISDVLSDDAARAPQFGRNSALTLPGREVAAKTGTTDSFRDAWTVGYTPQLSAGVWLGNNDNTPMNRTGGSVGAAPIWNEFMRRALADTPAQNFERPSGVKEMTVDKLTGLLPNGGATKQALVTNGNAPRDKSPTNTGSASECKPTVQLTSPSSGSLDSDTVQIQATATSQEGITQVQFSVDGGVIATDTQPPFTTTTTLDSGSHTITATATGNCAETVNANGLHSERPTNPAWENPVQAFIRTNRIKLDGEDAKDDSKTATDSVTVQLKGQATPSPEPDTGNGNGNGTGLNNLSRPVGYLRDDQFVA
jgi:penicillin-binding protein 1C